MDITATSPKLFSFAARLHDSWISRDTPDDGAANLQLLQDEVLLRYVQEGDKEAMSCLFHRYARTLHEIGRRILRDKTEAEDLVQEVFLYIHRKSSVFDSSKGSASSWIVQVAYSQALLRRRRLKSQGFYLSGIAEKAEECGKVNGKEPDYDHTVEGLFGRNVWKRIVEDLTHDQRETLRLHFFEGYTFTEIAEKLGQSHANVRNHHYRGLEKLRGYLDCHRNHALQTYKSRLEKGGGHETRKSWL